mgnify:CR=1 FL=1
MQPLIEYSHKTRKPIRSKQTLSRETEKTVKMLIVTLAIMILVLTGFFLGITNDTAQKGYTLQQEKIRYEELINQNNNINAKITSDAAFSKLEQHESINTMEDTEEKLYLTTEDNLVN